MKIRIKKTGEIVDAVEYKDAYYVTYGPSEYWGFFPKQDAEVVEEPLTEKEIWYDKKYRKAEAYYEQWDRPLSYCKNLEFDKEGHLKVKEPKMKEFDFEGWWDGLFASDAVGVTRSGILQSLRPLHEKMIAWGFEYIHIHWGKGIIEVSGAGVPFLHKPFTDICDFPRALKEAFKWMYENRKDRAKQKCDKDGPCDGLKKRIGDTDTDRNTYLDVRGFSHCPFCGERRL